jgi:hypothetical protein
MVVGHPACFMIFDITPETVESELEHLEDDDLVKFAAYLEGLKTKYDAKVAEDPASTVG